MSMNFSDAIEVIVDCGLLLEELGHGPHRQKIEDAVEAIELDHDPKWRNPFDKIPADPIMLHHVWATNLKGEDSVILGYKLDGEWFIGDGDLEHESFNSLDLKVQGYQPIRRPKPRQAEGLAIDSRVSHAFVDKSELEWDRTQELLCIDEWSQEQIDAFEMELQGFGKESGESLEAQQQLINHLAAVAFHEICKRSERWPSEV